MSYYRSPLGARFTRTPLRFDHQHPEYRDFQKLWMKCRHTFMGEEAVKDQMIPSQEGNWGNVRFVW